MFDPRVIVTLADNLGNKGLAFRFLSDYFDLLPRRMQRIIHALHDDDPEAAMDAILSLKIASAMVGAHDAEVRSRALQSLVAIGRLESACQEANALGAAVDILVTASSRILSSLRPQMDSDLAGVLPSQAFPMS